MGPPSHITRAADQNPRRRWLHLRPWLHDYRAASHSSWAAGAGAGAGAAARHPRRSGTRRIRIWKAILKNQFFSLVYTGSRFENRCFQATGQVDVTAEHPPHLVHLGRLCFVVPQQHCGEARQAQDVTRRDEPVGERAVEAAERDRLPRRVRAQVNNISNIILDIPTTVRQ
jgi:hypothetical protein